MKTSSLFIISLFCLGLLVFPGRARAQSEDTPSGPQIIFQENKSHQINRSDNLSLVRELINRRALISAADLLEQIYAQDPSDHEVVSLLIRCFFELKAYPKAELLLQRQLETSPFDFQYQYQLLEVYLKEAVDSSVNAQITSMLGRFPGNPDIYRSIIQKLVEYGLNDRAQDLIKQGRLQFGNESLFAFESAALLETKGEYYEAVMEYFRATGADTFLVPEADRKIASLIRYPGAQAEVIRALQTILNSAPNNIHALNMLQEAYVKSNRLEAAFDLSIRIDSLTNGDGRELFRYLRQCRERKLFDQVIRMSEYIDRRDFRKDLISGYKFLYAEALARVKRYPEAISNYNFIIANYPSRRDKAEAILAIGNIYRYELLNYDSARICYDSVITLYSTGSAGVAASLEKAALYLVGGQLDSASLIYAQLQNNPQAEDKKEFMAYSLAMILLFRKQFGEADLAFRKLIEEYPRGFYVNDALINSLTIRESQPLSPQSLSDYAEALYFQARLLPDSVEARFKSIIGLGDTPLLGPSIYKLATLFAEQNDTLNALSIIDEMERQHTDNYFYPYTLKLKGDILSRLGNRKGEAVQVYKNILEKYGNYPFIGEVRESLQQIENVPPAS